MKRRRYMMTALGHSNPPPELTPVTVAYIDFTQESGEAAGKDTINGGCIALRCNLAVCGYKHLLLAAANYARSVPCPVSGAKMKGFIFQLPMLDRIR